MKPLLPIVVLILAFVAEQAISQTPQSPSLTNNGVIEGTITRAGNAEPLPGVTVQLSIALAARGAGITPTETVLDTTTDEKGHFIFKDLYPGPYQLLYMRNGYFPISQGAQANVELGGATGSFRGGTGGGSRPGPGPAARGASQTISFALVTEQPVKLTIQMVPEAVISGRVIDSTSQPVTNAHISALRIEYPDGVETLTTARNALTDDRGEYRIFGLEAGTYYVRSDYHLSANPDVEFRSYFPGVDGITGALPIMARAGTESRATNIIIQPTTAVKVNGTVVVPNSSNTSAASLPAGGSPADLYLVPRDKGLRDGTVTSSNYTTTLVDRASIKFEMRNVSPGQYDLYAVVRTPLVLTGHIALNVGNHDLDGIDIAISSGVDLQTRISGKDAAAQSQIPGQLVLRIRDGIPGQDARPGRGGSAGEWRVYNGLTEGRYVLDSQLASLRDAYVADIKQGDKSIYETGTILIGTSPPEPVEVILDRPAGAIDGIVLKTSGQPASGASVILIPNGNRRENPMLYKRAASGSDGKFTLGALAPGMYKLFAWESIPKGAEMNAEFMKDYEDGGIPITVELGAHLKVQLPLIPGKEQ